MARLLHALDVAVLSTLESRGVGLRVLFEWSQVRTFRLAIRWPGFDVVVLAILGIPGVVVVQVLLNYYRRCSWEFPRERLLDYCVVVLSTLGSRGVGVEHLRLLVLLWWQWR